MLWDRIEATNYLQSCRLELQAAWIVRAGWTSWPVWTGHQSSSWQRPAVWYCSIITSGSVCFVTHFQFCDTLLSAVIQQSQILHLFIKVISPSPLFLHTFYCKKEEANTELQWILSRHGDQPNSILAAWFKYPACFYMVIKNTESGKGPCSGLVMLPYFWSLLAQYQNYKQNTLHFLLSFWIKDLLLKTLTSKTSQAFSNIKQNAWRINCSYQK